MASTWRMSCSATTEAGTVCKKSCGLRVSESSSPDSSLRKRSSVSKVRATELPMVPTTPGLATLVCTNPGCTVPACSTPQDLSQAINSVYSLRSKTPKRLAIDAISAARISTSWVCSAMHSRSARAYISGRSGLIDDCTVIQPNSELIMASNCGMISSTCPLISCSARATSMLSSRSSSSNSLRSSKRIICGAWASAPKPWKTHSRKWRLKLCLTASRCATSWLTTACAAGGKLGLVWLAPKAFSGLPARLLSNLSINPSDCCRAASRHWRKVIRGPWGSSDIPSLCGRAWIMFLHYVRTFGYKATRSSG